MGTHDGHRARLREIFHNAGVSGLTEVNMLELLLFYALPRRDTNPIAHRLIDRFGTLEAVFEADMDTLMTVEGVGESAATLLRLTGGLRIDPPGAGLLLAILFFS